MVVFLGLVDCQQKEPTLQACLGSHLARVGHARREIQLPDSAIDTFFHTAGTIDNTSSYEHPSIG